MAAQTYRGVVRGNTIELTQPPELPEGTEVEMLIVPEGGLRPGSPAAVLFLLANTLTPEEAAALREAVAEMRKLGDYEIPAGH
ncbi:MAG: hypothetical protein N2554_09215 [Fimbriimonadales bacterium]|nr:hypothetical protein [Fimbriimonadales bacterium]